MNRPTAERQLLKNALEPGDGCLSIEQLGRLHDGLLSPMEARATNAHLAACPSCRVEREMLQEFQTVDVRAGEAEVVRAGRQRLRSRAPEIFGSAAIPQSGWSWLWNPAVFRPALAMAAVLLVSTTVYLWRPPVSGLPANIDTAHDVTRSLSVVLLGPAGDVVEPPRRLEWQPVNGAVRYRVRVMEVDRHEVWASDVAAVFG